MKPCCLLALLFCLLVLPRSFAQSTDAIVSGTVNDSSGAVVAGASVTARNLATGVLTITFTNAAGVYSLPPLPYGKYEFVAEHPGFRKNVTENVTLEAAAKLTLNSVLEVGAVTESVEVQASASTLTFSTATLAHTISHESLQDLPITGRDAMSFIFTQPGMGSIGSGFNGTRSGALNITTDGIVTMSNRIDGLYPTGIVSSSGLLGTTSFQAATRIDRVEEVNIVTSPFDVEYGRGLGQLQLITRSGSNAFHGSVFEEHRDTDLNANNWFANAAGVNPITGQMLQPRQILVSNQFGGRVGGPIKRNKTFFNFYYEGQRQVAKNNIVAAVLTAQARQGIFRYYPGVLNSNAQGAVPTVDAQGNPVQPPTATGSLQSVNLFGLDPARPSLDASGVLAQNIKNMPLPNYFLANPLAGSTQTFDGLNIAGYAWQQRVPTTFDTFEGRVDHNFSDNQRLQLSFNHVAYDTSLPGALPTSPAGRAHTASLQGTIVLNSILRANLLNEIRIGIYRPQVHVYSGYDPSTGGPSALYRQNGSPYLIAPITFSPVVPIDSALDGYANITPNYQYGDNMTWIKGRHSFKGGFEARLISYAGYDIANIIPRVFFGQGFAPAGLTTTNLPGVGANITTAQNLLYDLSGSVSAVSQTLNAPSGSSTFLPGLTRYAWLKQPEYSWYFKDDIKVNANLTLNLGVRYELFQVPYEAHGDAIAPVGGGYSVFGISGNSWSAVDNPGVLNGQLETPQQIGPGGPNPNTSLYKGDHNNFAPGIGFAYALPWLGKEKTVFRAGYGVSYERLPIYATQFQTIYAPGLGQTFTNFPASQTNLTNVSVPVTPTNAPLQQIPLNSNPYASRQLTFNAFDPNLRTPYIQNWSASLSRALPGDSRIEVRYVGTKGTKLIRGTNVNEVNVLENGIASAFKTVQAGGDSALINQIFGRYAPAGVTGSQYVLTNATTQTFFANSNVGGFANFINNSTNFTPGVPGGLLLNAGLPQNFVLANPQYLTAFLIGNDSASTYHSLQAEFTKRYSKGLVLQTSFTYERYLGDYTATNVGVDDAQLSAYSFRTNRDRNLDKGLLDRKFFWRTNGLWDLPFGRNRWIGRNSSGWVNELIGGWQLGTILNVFSGVPINIVGAATFDTAGFTSATPGGTANALLTSPYAGNLASIVGAIPSGSATEIGNGVQYYTQLKQVLDPQIAQLASNLRALSLLRAIVNSSGNLIFQNAAPGAVGNTSPGQFFGPGYYQFDANLIKKFRIKEGMDFQLGANATNILNHPQWSAPNNNINSVNFGRITSTIIPNRVIVLTGRFSF